MLVAQRAGGQRLAGRRAARLPEVVELALRQWRVPGVEQVGIGQGDVPQPDAGDGHAATTVDGQRCRQLGGTAQERRVAARQLDRRHAEQLRDPSARPVDPDQPVVRADDRGALGIGPGGERVRLLPVAPVLPTQPARRPVRGLGVAVGEEGGDRRVRLPGANESRRRRCGPCPGRRWRCRRRAGPARPGSCPRRRLDTGQRNTMRRTGRRAAHERNDGGAQRVTDAAPPIHPARRARRPRRIRARPADGSSTGRSMATAVVAERLELGDEPIPAPRAVPRADGPETKVVTRYAVPRPCAGRQALAARPRPGRAPAATGSRTWFEPATGWKPPRVSARTTTARSKRGHLKVTRPASACTSGTPAASAAMRTATARKSPSTGSGIGPNRSRSSVRSASTSASEWMAAKRR